MIRICQKNKDKVYEAIRTGNIDAAEMSFPNLIDDILLTMKKHGLTELLPARGCDGDGFGRVETTATTRE